MPIKLSPSDIKSIIRIINNWPEQKLTYDLLIEAIKTNLGISRTRQALQNNPAIKMAFDDRKQAMRQASVKTGWVKDIKEANAKIESQAQEIARLQSINQQLLERFVIWQKNAINNGVTEQKLNQPVSTLKPVRASK